MKLKPLALDLRLVFPGGNRLPIGTAELTTVHRAPDGAEDFAGPIFDPDGRKSGHLYCTIAPAEKRRRGRPPSSDRKIAAALSWASGYMTGRMGAEEADRHASCAVLYDPRNVRKHRRDLLAGAVLLRIEDETAQAPFGAYLIAAPEIAEGPGGELRISGTATCWKSGTRVTTGRVSSTMGTPPPGLREMIGAGRPLCLILGGGNNSGNNG